MLELYLVRHAEAEKMVTTDIARRLTAAGKQAVKQLAKRLQHAKKNPDIILASTAERTAQTAEILIKELSIPHHTSTAAIYEADVTTLLTVIQSIPHHHSRAMLIGHNPGISAIASELTGSNLPSLAPCGIYLI